MNNLIFRLHPPQWAPSERATLLFVIEGEKVLLIEKKRGLGAGKVNAPGGRLEPGETFHCAAVRETREEIGITPIAPVHIGHLWFEFTNGYRLECAVFRASNFEGQLMETTEARPFWSLISEIPYDRMWEDDRYWLPGLIEGRPFGGWFRFDGDRMLEKEVSDLPEGARFPF